MPKHAIYEHGINNELERAIADFNDMPHGQSFGLTPNEVLAGPIPDRGFFKDQISSGVLKRVQENQAYNCRLHCRTDRAE